MNFDAGQGQASKPYPMTDFTADLFLPHLGELFEWERPTSRNGTGEGHAQMHLIEVTRQPHHPGVSREPFSLLFRMKGQRALAWGLHTLVHPEFERCELLLSRVRVPQYERKDPDGIYYEAVFS